MAKLTPGVIGAFVAVFVGFILSTVGIFTARWIRYYGLFEACDDNGNCATLDLSIRKDFFKATAAMEILAFIAALTAFVGAVVYVVMALIGSLSQFRHSMPVLVLISSLVEIIFAIIGCIIYASKMFQSRIPNYSFFLTIIGSIILLVGGIVFYLNRNKSQVG